MRKRIKINAPASLRQMPEAERKNAIVTLRDFAERQRACRVSMSQMVSRESLEGIEWNGRVFDCAADIFETFFGRVPVDPLPGRLEKMTVELRGLRDEAYNALKERQRADMAERALIGADAEIAELQKRLNELHPTKQDPLVKLMTNRPTADGAVK